MDELTEEFELEWVPKFKEEVFSQVFEDFFGIVFKVSK